MDEYFRDYAKHHRTRGNQLSHALGIPLIMLGLLGLLARVVLSRPGFLQIDLGSMLWVGAAIWYLRKSPTLGAPFALVTLGFYFAGRALSMPTLRGLFVLGWIFQGIGHAVYEKRSPAFIENALHVLVGPLWLFAKIVGPRNRL